MIAAGLPYSDRVVDLLCEQLAGKDENADALIAGDITANLKWLALDTLAKIGPPKRVAPLLLDHMHRDPEFFRCHAYTRALVATRDPRLVPAIVVRLGKNLNKGSTVGDGGKTYSLRMDDHYLYILLQLTGQPPKAYELNVSASNRNMLLGFATDEARTAAYEKMRTWWAEHNDQPPYKDLDPLPTTEQP